MTDAIRRAPCAGTDQPREGRWVRRRELMQWPAAAAAGLMVPHPAGAQPSPPAGGARLALLIGNRDYPPPYDLPSMGKNVKDLEDALARRGFEVSAHVDMGLAQMRDAISAFAQRVAGVGDDAVVFFYFSGHGSQVDAENLLVSANTNPASALRTVEAGSTVLGRDVVRRLPRPARGQLIAVIDACRTGLSSSSPADGLNQVEAPQGCLIVFSTGAGKPALAPTTDTISTFFTAALVRQINQASDELTFSDVMRLAKLDTQRTMENHPVALVREFAQYPFIAEGTTVPMLLARPAAPVAVPGPAGLADAVPQRFGSAEEARDWQALQATTWPPDLRRRAEAFMTTYPESKLRSAALVAREGAGESAALLARGDIRLFRSSFVTDGLGEGEVAELARAARGDKDAAARIGRRWATRADRGPSVSRYEGWMQYAAELGNGIASYELALHYRRLDQPLAAARWDAHSRQLGYTPPPSLDNRRK